MDFFHDGQYVRLRSRVRGRYLHADDNGHGVSLSARSESMNTVWQAQRVQRYGVTCVLLQSSAYGRYLAVSHGLAPTGHRGHSAFQRGYATPQQEDIAWIAQTVTPGGSVVRLRHLSNRLLRANGKYRLWNNGVSVDDVNDQSTMMHWVVQFVQTRLGPPDLPLLSPDHRSEALRRMILYVRAETLDYFDPHARRTFWFEGRSVFQLRHALAKNLGEGDYLAIMMCVRAGPQGRLIPLITDLPRNEAPMFVVVLTTGLPAASELQYPVPGRTMRGTRRLLTTT